MGNIIKFPGTESAANAAHYDDDDDYYAQAADNRPAVVRWGLWLLRWVCFWLMMVFRPFVVIIARLSLPLAGGAWLFSPFLEWKYVFLVIGIAGACFGLKFVYDDILIKLSGGRMVLFG